MKSKNKCRFRIGDPVIVIVGKDKGKVSNITTINKKKSTVIVKDVNFVKKNIASENKKKRGEKKTIEKPIHISNIMFFDKEEQKRSRIGYMPKTSKNKSRFLKKTGKQININLLDK